MADRKDPFTAFRFRVEIEGIDRGGFRECSGLDTTQDPIEYREGTEIPTVRKLAGLVKYSNITLKWGMTDDPALWQWRQDVAEGKIAKSRKSGSIVLLDDEGNEKLRWNFREGWPTKWTGPSFNATGNEVAIEQLDIAHEGVKKA